MENVTRAINWKLTTGKNVTVSATLHLTKTHNLDGHEIVVECCELGPVKAVIEGHPTQYGYTKIDHPIQVNGLTAVATIGKLAVTGENADKIDAMINDLRNHPAYVAKERKVRMNEKEIDEMEARRTANGLCPKCGSYCSGDCEAN